MGNLIYILDFKENKVKFNGGIASGIQTLAISFKQWIEQGVCGGADFLAVLEHR
ncbi:hypothetical protein [Bacillus pumilus]|uniref:hypothetical protein n=1 Tax=Bacillus pumilus TaxID=1408 RepID=UPI00164253CD|nr:hypothetical protein [Bacillus pumilus]